jgi:hypothetical protein
MGDRLPEDEALDALEPIIQKAREVLARRRKELADVEAQGRDTFDAHESLKRAKVRYTFLVEFRNDLRRRAGPKPNARELACAAAPCVMRREC